MRIASWLKMGKQECMQKHTSSEFVDWCVFLDEHAPYFMWEPKLLAQIAWAIHICMSDWKGGIEAFLPKPIEDPANKKPMTKEEAIAQAKAKWFGALNLNSEGKFIGKIKIPPRHRAKRDAKPPAKQPKYPYVRKHRAARGKNESDNATGNTAGKSSG
jgi:hypothetical protein